ncbi:MAG: anti-sigma factor [Gemmatimonadetes bacterium]|nr:anti-sigma factor [Gemmatimonadota bacterium]
MSGPRDRDDAADLEGAALDALSDVERARLRASLADDADAGREFDRLRGAAASLAAVLPGLREPGGAGTRARLLARAAADGQARKARSLTPTVSSPVPPPPSPRMPLPAVWFGAAAVGLAAALLLLVQSRAELRDARTAFAETERARRRAADSLEALVAEQDRRLAALTGSRVRVVDLTTQEAGKPYARMFWDQATNRWTFVAHRLPALTPGRTYQLWLVSGGRRISAGTFGPDARGEAVVRAEVALAPGALAAVAVTQEPAGGVPQPTGAMVVAGKATP